MYALHFGQLERAVRQQGLITSWDWLLWPLEMPWLVPHELDSLLAPAHKSLREAQFICLTAEDQVVTQEQAVTYAVEIT